MARKADEEIKRKAAQIQQAVHAGAEPAEAVEAAFGAPINRITVPDTVTNYAGVAEDIDSQVFVEEYEGMEAGMDGSPGDYGRTGG